MLKLFIVILLLYQANGQDNNYFCNLTCDKVPNTACSRKDCDVSPNCGPNGIQMPFKNADRIVLTELHNLLRNEVAEGLDPRFEDAASSNMHILSYDKELEYVAQCWANACGWLDHQFHDVCRITSKFNHVGQNIFRGSITGTPGLADYMNFTSECINNWYNGIAYINSTIIDSFRKTKEEIEKNHYTQMMWAKTTHFGCGRTQYFVDGSYYLTIVCNYGPGGNIEGQPVYNRGKPCSGCNQKQCSNSYKALCGKMRSLEDDNWIHPSEQGKSKCSKLNAHFYTTFLLIYLGLRCF